MFEAAATLAATLASAAAFRAAHQERAWAFHISLKWLFRR